MTLDSVTIIPDAIEAQELFYKFFTEEGTPLNSNINKIGSLSTPITYSITALTEEPLILDRLNISILPNRRIVDVNTTKLDWIFPTLENGFLLNLQDEFGNIKLDILDGSSVRSLSDFADLSGADLTVYQSGVKLGFNFSSSGTRPLLLEGESINVIIRDDMSHISQIRGMVQGVNARRLMIKKLPLN